MRNPMRNEVVPDFSYRYGIDLPGLLRVENSAGLIQDVYRSGVFPGGGFGYNGVIYDNEKVNIALAKTLEAIKGLRTSEIFRTLGAKASLLDKTIDSPEFTQNVASNLRELRGGMSFGFRRNMPSIDDEKYRQAFFSTVESLDNQNYPKYLRIDTQYFEFGHKDMTEYRFSDIPNHPQYPYSGTGPEILYQGNAINPAMALQILPKNQVDAYISDIRVHMKNKDADEYTMQRHSALPLVKHINPKDAAELFLEPKIAEEYKIYADIRQSVGAPESFDRILESMYSTLHQRNPIAALPVLKKIAPELYINIQIGLDTDLALERSLDMLEFQTEHSKVKAKLAEGSRPSNSMLFEQEKPIDQEKPISGR